MCTRVYVYARVCACVRVCCCWFLLVGWLFGWVFNLLGLFISSGALMVWGFLLLGFLYGFLILSCFDVFLIFWGFLFLDFLMVFYGFFDFSAIFFRGF